MLRRTTILPTLLAFLFIFFVSFLNTLYAETLTAETCKTVPPSSHIHLTQQEIANALGWVSAPVNRCGGYYSEPAIHYSEKLQDNHLIQMTSNQVLFSEQGTSISEGEVTITRFGQQIKANKACLYRDPVTGKINSIDLLGNVTLREPNHLITAKRAHYDIPTGHKSLWDILYRTAIHSPPTLDQTADQHTLSEKTHTVESLSAWGQASTFTQIEPRVYRFEGASYTTCPPLTSVWKLKASSITLDKNEGRGHATHARLLIKDIPILYAPYFNFPIDSRRQTGFLTPTIGHSHNLGMYLTAPFYWNLAPNYDTTITPAYLSLRGFQLTDLSRYLTPSGEGALKFSLLPHDNAFVALQETYQNTYGTSSDPTTEADLRRLQNASTFRKAFSWQDNKRFNDHWTTHIDYNYVSDDYFLNDFGVGLNEVTQNQLLQEANAIYKGQYWNFLGRIQSYQTLHPLNQPLFQNQYQRMPQLNLQGDYPSESTGFDYFVGSDFTRFSIQNTPGSVGPIPMGNRINLQPGISRPFNWPYLYINPRLQFALTQYVLGDTGGDPASPHRALPIFDVSSGMYFDRHLHFAGWGLRQTLEPQLYYTYIPYRNQNDIPIFDTTLNILTYDQLFTYNRFSSIDRIGDANQISLGVTTRFIDEVSGTEKAKAGLGEIIYFRNRLVTLCSDFDCPITTPDPENTTKHSPLSGFLTYQLNSNWSFTANTIWNPSTLMKVNNQSLLLQYKPFSNKIINLGYNFVRNRPDDPTLITVTPPPNLSQTDISFSWHLFGNWSHLGRWTQDWNQSHFQNLLYGLQYDSCCWAMRLIAGKTFVNLNSNNTPQYNPQIYIQFDLKGLGVYSPFGDPSSLLSNSVSGYVNNFGQDF